MMGLRITQVFLAVLAFSTISWAQSEPLPGASIATEAPEPTLWESIRPDRITHWSMVDGPALNNINDPYNADGTVKRGGLYTWSQVSFQWQVDDKTRFVLNPRFESNPNTIDPNTPNLTWDDPVIGFNRTWFSSGKWSLAGSINTIIPFARTQGNIGERRILNPGGFQFLSYRYSNKLSFDAQIWGRVHIYDGQGAPVDEDRFSYFVAPQVTYRWTDKLQTIAFYQIDGGMYRTATNDFVNRIESDDRLNLQVSYQIAQQLTVQPMLTLFRSQAFSLNKANVNMWVSGRFF